MRETCEPPTSTHGGYQTASQLFHDSPGTNPVLVCTTLPRNELSSQWWALSWCTTSSLSFPPSIIQCTPDHQVLEWAGHDVSHHGHNLFAK